MWENDGLPPGPPLDAKNEDGSGLTRRELFARLTRAGLVAPFALSSIAAAAQKPSAPTGLRIVGTKAVLKPSDIRFVGFYRFGSMPSSLSGQQRPSLGARRVGSSTRLFINGNWPDCELYELNHPDGEPNQDLASAPTLTLHRNWGLIRDGHRIAAGGSTSKSAVIPGGFFWEADRNALWWSYGDAYTQTNHPSIGCTILNDSNGTFQSYGPWRVQLGAVRAIGSMLTIPAAFAATYLNGKTVGAISSPVSGATHSHGAALTALDFPNPTTTPPNTSGNTAWAVAAHEILWHSKDHPQARDARYKLCRAIGTAEKKYDCSAGSTLVMGDPIWGSQSPGSGTTDGMLTSQWIDLPDKHGLLYFGSLARTPEGYNAPYDADGLIHRGYAQLAGSPPQCCHGQTDPWFSSTGPWTHVRQPMGWIYDPTDLVAPATKAATPYSRKPVHHFAWNTMVPQMPLQNPGPCFGMGSVFIPESRRLYVPFLRFDGTTNPSARKPAVLVFQVA